MVRSTGCSRFFNNLIWEKEMHSHDAEFERYKGGKGQDPPPFSYLGGHLFSLRPQCH